MATDNAIDRFGEKRNHDRIVAIEKDVEILKGLAQQMQEMDDVLGLLVKSNNGVCGAVDVMQKAVEKLILCQKNGSA